MELLCTQTRENGFDQSPRFLVLTKRIPAQGTFSKISRFRQEDFNPNSQGGGGTHTHTLWGRTYLYSPYKGVPPRAQTLQFYSGALAEHELTR